MASAIDTAKPEGRREVGTAGGRLGRLGSMWPGSRLGRLIVGLNLLGLAILIVGALAMNELSKGLINAKIDSLKTQGASLVNVIEQVATQGEPSPALDPDKARDTLQLLYVGAQQQQLLFVGAKQRARVFDVHGGLIADSDIITDKVDSSPLPPARKPGVFQLAWPRMGGRDSAAGAAKAQADLDEEIGEALRGHQVAGLRRARNGARVVSISLPIRYVQDVLGVLTLESGDVDQIITAQRWALLPFILIAIGVSLTSSALLSRFIALPVLRLARAADSVTLARARAISLPDIAGRDDELGDLATSLETMTSALSERMDAIERFAADVAHEIRNPLTSIRSAVETLDLVTDPASQERLTNILKHDVGRLDRLITDISNASRLDAELARERPRPLNLEKLLSELAGFYTETGRPGEVAVRFMPPESLEPVSVPGREGPLSQVFRNLIDNARSFSSLSTAEHPEVRLGVRREGRQMIATVEDDGPGLPAENLETVFERFYTARPKGAAFGGHSGLGLSIARQVVEAHGGTIRAENRTDADGKVVGARFVVTLPDGRS
jgi:two-component system, OmpR family, sensor histidine kinase ChvG